MSIDKQRIEAVRVVEALGYTFDGFKWTHPTRDVFAQPTLAEPDAMHALLVMRADKLQCYGEGSEDEVEYKTIVEAIEAYEAVRWPDGKIPGGKG